MVEIHKYSVKQCRWPPHFRTFCELVEGEENKLTTFSTWTIMLGCNIIFRKRFVPSVANPFTCTIYGDAKFPLLVEL